MDQYRRRAMPDNLILSYDVGTSGTKAVVTDLRQIVSSAYRPYNVNYPRPGWAEQDPRIWWQAIKETTQEILKKVQPSEISGISF
jgi:sugar (pentulose or hexulose) kinase